jgi:hypothetical protein
VKRTHAEQVEHALLTMKRVTLSSLLMQAKGSRQESADRVSVQVLRDALTLCMRIGRITSEQVVPLSAKKGKHKS